MSIFYLPCRIDLDTGSAFPRLLSRPLQPAAALRAYPWRREVNKRWLVQIRKPNCKHPSCSMIGTMLSISKTRTEAASYPCAALEAYSMPCEALFLHASRRRYLFTFHGRGCVRCGVFVYRQICDVLAYRSNKHIIESKSKQRFRQLAQIPLQERS